MAKFMNAELEHIRDNLRCGHCEALFKGSDSQAWKVKYETGTVYCSTICRHAALRNKFSTPIPNRGPCPTCGKEFFSRRTNKQFCGLECYLKSSLYAAHMAKNREKSWSAESRAKNAATQRTGQFVACLECGSQFYQKRSDVRHRFCSTPCYRAYLAKRFDRWVANPERLALPQCYDEFLDQQELSCLVDGCSWHGHGLTHHMNFTHGVQAKDFKRAAGFNITSGIISKPLAQIMAARANVGVGLVRYDRRLPEPGFVREYISKEGNEHRRKGRAMAIGPGPQRQCRGCGISFIQTTPFGRALYCSVACRTEVYNRKKIPHPKVRAKNVDGTFRWVEPPATGGDA